MSASSYFENKKKEKVVPQLPSWMKLELDPATAVMYRKKNITKDTPVFVPRSRKDWKRIRWSIVDEKKLPYLRLNGLGPWRIVYGAIPKEYFEPTPTAPPLSHMPTCGFMDS